MIHLQHVTYYYPETHAPVLNNLNLDIADGEFVLLVGPSGCGKSTLLRCLNGLVPHFYGGKLQGQIEVAGFDPTAQEPRGMSSVVGFVFQDPETQFVVDTVESELVFAMENANLPQPLMRKRVEEVLDQLGIAHLRQRRISTLSGGEKQRVTIAAILTLQPRIIVLDEPTSQLDPQAAEEVLTILQKLNSDLGMTVVLSEHRLERVVQYVDRMLYLPGAGKALVSGTPQQVLPQLPWAPPLVDLGRRLGWHPLPLTIKEARKHLADLPAARAPHSTVPAPIQMAVTIDINNLWYAYNGHPALKGVSFQARQGEIIALMGRNGSGKSTLLKQLVGLLQPQRGQVLVAGLDTRQVDADAIIKQVGYVPQNPNSLLFAETVDEEIAFTRHNHHLSDHDDGPLLDSLQLGEFRQRYPRDLSVGERQRVALAAILAAEPQIILLDEPTRGLDYAQKELLSAFLRREKSVGHTVILATHDVELAAVAADRVIILGDGEVVVDGPTRAVMTQSMVFSSQINKLLHDDRFLTVSDILRDAP
ncbi:MAG: ATP-binding cassette domain-containing protein [Chloroflexi bacterium]|nr:ATP-binding cassette domain-containing protein [Chloroflexota bacterium]